MEIRHDFRLNFMTHRGELMTLNIPHADADALGSEVSDAMAAVINSGIVYSVRGEPIVRHSAELVKTERKDFSIFD